MEVPYKMPPTIRPMIRLSPPSKIGAASISEMEAVMSLDEASKSYVYGMPMRGITVESTANVTQNGHEGKHLKGYISLAGSSNTFPVETYIIMAPECILSIEVIGPEASSMINEVLSWIDFQKTGVSTKKPKAKESSGRSIWEYVSMAMILVAACYAIFSSVNSRRKKKTSLG